MGLTKDAVVITQYPDGTWLISHTLVGVNLPPDLLIQIQIEMQGGQFLDGSTLLEIRPEDFDSNGLLNIYYELPDTGGSPKLCHYLKVF